MALVLATAGCHDEHWLTYPWDDRGILCSQPMDDLKESVPWDLVEDQMEEAQLTSSVLTLHAHIPGQTISVKALERVLDMADAHHLAYVTYRDLAAPNPTPRAGLAFAFDDSAIYAWINVRDILLAHHARVTFFVTRWAMASESDRDELHTLYGDGHASERIAALLTS